jgi:carboxyl-terminal processing protease
VSKSRLSGVAASVILVTSLFVVLPRLGAQEGEPPARDKQASEPKEEKEGRDGLYRPLGLFTEVLALVRSNYVEPVELKPLLAGAFSGMTEAMDPFAEYIPAEQMAAFKAAEDARGKGNVVDAGLVLARRLGYPFVVSAVAGGPAASAGLESDDLIEKVGGQAVRQLPIWEVQSRLSGKPGKKIDLLVVRDGKPRHRSLTITLSSWSPEGPKTVRALGETIVRIADFAPGTAASLKALIAPFDRTKPLILDLRGNASGSFDEAATAAGLFVPAGPIGELKGRKVEGKKWASAEGERIHESPVILLVDSGTGGPAELFAGAIRESEKVTVKDQKKVRLVGEPTFGAGSVLDVVPLSSGGALKLSVAKVRTASGRALSPKGLEPDDRVYPTPHDEGQAAPADLILQRGVKLLAEMAARSKSAS